MITIWNVVSWRDFENGEHKKEIYSQGKFSGMKRSIEAESSKLKGKERKPLVEDPLGLSYPRRRVSRGLNTGSAVVLLAPRHLPLAQAFELILPLGLFSPLSFELGPLSLFSLLGHT